MKILSKQPSDFNLSDFDLLYDYLLLINPEGEANESTTKGKKEFAYNYEIPKTKVTRSHITLANFLQPDLFEAEIIDELQKVAANSNQIRVILKDYAWFDKVIYYNVEHKIDIQQLVRKITNDIKRLMITERKLDSNIRKQLSPRFILTPHLTLCKDLTPEQLERSKIEFAYRKFYAEFVAKEIILLKRHTNSCQEIGRFKLNGPDMLTIVRQGNLFQ